MKSIKKRIIAIVLAIGMLITMSPFAVMAEENNEHVHNWTYEEMGYLWAGCFDCDAYAELHVSEYGPEIKINSEKWCEAGLTITEVWYEGDESTKYEKSTVKPTAPGKYKVTVIAQGQTLEKDCVITADCTDNNHTWNVTIEDDYDTTYAYIKCENDKCSLSYDAIRMYFYATDEEFGLDISGIDNDAESYLKEIGFNNYSITYEGVSPTVYTQSTTKPTQVGKYKATIQLADKTIVEEFKITQECEVEEHQWHGIVEKDNDNSRFDVRMICKNELCSYNCYKATYVTLDDFYNKEYIYYDEKWDTLGIEKATLTYERIYPIKGEVLNEFPTEVGEYKVNISFEDVSCNVKLLLTRNEGKSVYRRPYGSLKEYMYNSKSILGLTASQLEILRYGDTGFESELSVRNLGSDVDTNSKKKILEKISNNEKAIFCNLDLYACAFNQPIYYIDNDMDLSQYFDFSRMVDVASTTETLDVYLSANEFVLGKTDFSNNNLKVLRYHNGNVEVLDTEISLEKYYRYSDTDEMETRISFKTDKFSDDTIYALVYTETEIEEDTSCKCASVIEVKGKEATCTEDGTKTYYKCASCSKKYSDAEGKQEIQDTDLVIKSKGHKLTAVQEKKATCKENGIKAHYICSVCNKKYEDADGKKELQDSDLVVKAEGHKLTKVEEKKATCKENGTKAHYICSVCNKKYNDAEGKIEIQDSDIVIKATGQHKEEIIQGYAATCCAPGLTNGKKCSECGDIIEAQKTIEKTEHLIIYVPAKVPTYTSNGYKAYWKCAYCGDMFSDRMGTKTTNSKLITINKLQVGVTKSIKAKTRKSSSIMFTWNKVSGVSGYRVYVAKNGKWTQLKSATTATSYTAKKLLAGTNYKFAVKAYKKVNGKVIWSNSYKSVTLKTLPGKTNKISSKSAGKGKVTLSWNKVKGASGYRFYYKQGKKWVTLKSSMSGNKVKVTGLKVGKKYTFAVKAYAKENGKTIWSDVFTSKTVTGPKK